jgi:hypothetical protein
MSSQAVAKPEYGNWVPKRIIYLSGFVGLVLLCLGFLFWVLVVPAVLFFLVAVYFVYAWHQFSPQGGNLQDRIWKVVLEWRRKSTRYRLRKRRPYNQARSGTHKGTCYRN